jgi:hypothetical protein
MLGQMPRRKYFYGSRSGFGAFFFAGANTGAVRLDRGVQRSIIMPSITPE